MSIRSESESIPVLNQSSLELSGPLRTALLVLGMHRSATSALTRVLSLLGASLPIDLMPACSDNEAGFWESDALQHFHDNLLISAGSYWDDWHKFDNNWFATPHAAQFKKRAGVLLDQIFGDSSLFVLKDPRVCRFFPFWREILGEASIRSVCVLPFRNPIEVAASLQKRNAFEPSKSYLLWLRHVLDSELASRGCPRIFITYKDLLSDWRAVARSMQDNLGLCWPQWSFSVEIEVDDFLKERLRHNRASQQDLLLHSEIPDWVKSAYSALVDLTGNHESIETLETFDRLRDEFDRASHAIGVAVRGEELVRESSAGAAASHIKELEGLVDGKGVYLESVSSVINLFRLSLLYDLINDRVKLEEIQNLYHFYYEDLISIAANSYISNIELSQAPGVAQLFLDIGNGISEESTIKLPIKKNNERQELVFELSQIDNLHTLRFDPLNTLCIVEIEKFFIIKETEEIDLIDNIISTSCISKYNQYFFHTDDPQMYIENVSRNDFVGAKRLVINFRFIHLGKGVIGECINTLSVAYNQLIQAKEIENKKQVQLIQAKEIENKKQVQLIQAKEIENKKQVQLIQAKEIENKKQVQLIQEKEHLVQKLNATNNMLNQEITSLKKEIATVLTSNSWKLTRGVRRLNRLLKSLI